MTKPATPGHLISTTKAGRIAGVSKTTIVRWIHADKLTGHKHTSERAFKVDTAELEQLLVSRRPPPAVTPRGQLIGTVEAARIAGVSSVTILNWIRAGKLTAYKTSSWARRPFQVDAAELEEIVHRRLKPKPKVAPKPKPKVVKPKVVKPKVVKPKVALKPKPKVMVQKRRDQWGRWFLVHAPKGWLLRTRGCDVTLNLCLDVTLNLCLDDEWRDAWLQLVTNRFGAASAEVSRLLDAWTDLGLVGEVLPDDAIQRIESWHSWSLTSAG